MDLRTFLVPALLFHLGAASYLIKQIRHRRVLLSSTICEKGSYLDRNIGSNGRCQPCSEICGDNHMGNDDACEKHKEQCQVDMTPTQLTTEEIPVNSAAVMFTPVSTNSSTSDSPTVVIGVTIAAVFLAVLTCGILVWFIYKNCRRDPNDDDLETRTNEPRLIKPVEPNPLRESKDRIYVTEVTKDPLQPHQMALLQSFNEKGLSSLNSDEVYLNGLDQSARYNATSYQPVGSVNSLNRTDSGRDRFNQAVS